jgi:asparagine synthase (glutamine-hydrolysing)
MMTDSRSQCIVFNGEIYNFRELKRELALAGHTFRSDSDTEVILAAYREWGTECVTHLNGMFAFAIYDASRGHLFLARDRAGEKPLFYSLVGNELRFGSELKAMMADEKLPRKIDPEALDCYLSMGFVPGERCILQGFRKLPPAHAMTFSLARLEVRTWRYWELPRFSQENAHSGSQVELLAQLEQLLEDAVARQLVADVPVGVLLSGGIDSSLITAMAARNGRSVNTFTIRFPGHPKFDESRHARLIASHFGTNHEELDAGEATPELLPILARHFDEPIADSSMIPTYLVSRMARQRCTVALGGEGGDELFGGYLHYVDLLRMASKVEFIPLALRSSIARAASCVFPVGVKGRNRLQQMGCDLETDLPPVGSYFDRTTRQELIVRGDIRPLCAEAVRRQFISPDKDLLQRSTRYDFASYLPEDILVKVDRASMANSLEVRAPMLDYRIIEFAFGRISSNLKTTKSGRKILLKALAAKVLPSSFDRERKQGFSIPLAAWLHRAPLRQFFENVLHDGGSIFSKDFVVKLLNGQSQGRSNSERLFSLVMLELWRREFHATL